VPDKRVYPAFSEFYGMEETIERIVGFLRHAAQGLEERKQIMYLLGPVGGGKSSLAERLKALMEVHPIYVLKAGNELSPVFESPLGLFDPDRMGPLLEDRYGIPRRRLSGLMSPWCIKRLDEFNGDISQFRVQKLMPSRLRQYGVAKTEPGDENNQDISSLVGRVDIRKLELHAQNDPDAYSYSGGLHRANQGILEFVEMFKAPISLPHRPCRLAGAGAPRADRAIAFQDQTTVYVSGGDNPRINGGGRKVRSRRSAGQRSVLSSGASIQPMSYRGRYGAVPIRPPLEYRISNRSHNCNVGVRPRTNRTVQRDESNHAAQVLWLIQADAASRCWDLCHRIPGYLSAT
jgi:hypothetical protein